MHQPRAPVPAVNAEGESGSSTESLSGFWPLGAVDRALLTIDRHDKAAIANTVIARETEIAQLAAISKQIDGLSDPLSFWVTLFANAPIGFAVWKRDGTVLLVNNAVRTIFGSGPPPEYNILDDTTAADLGIAGAIRSAFEGKSISLPTFWYDPRDLRNVRVSEGRRVAISVSMFPLIDANDEVQYVAAVYRDDTQITLAQQQLKAESEQLERHIIGRTAELEEANQELEAFSYSVSHDLRAPLRAIDAFAALLAEDKDSTLSAAAIDCLRRIRAASSRMSELINDLLSFARLGKQSLEVKTVAVNQLVSEVLEELQPQIRGRNLDIRVESLPSCRADPALLREVFLNLLDNAIKFTGKKLDARIDVGTRVQDGQLVWHVADNGVGFDMAHYERLFGVFSRLHSNEEFEGTGVGLALVNRIIKRHGGEIWAYADRDKGATFYFTLGE